MRTCILLLLTLTGCAAPVCPRQVSAVPSESAPAARNYGDPPGFYARVALEAPGSDEWDDVFVPIDHPEAERACQALVEEIVQRWGRATLTARAVEPCSPFALTPRRHEGEVARVLADPDEQAGLFSLMDVRAEHAGENAPPVRVVHYTRLVGAGQCERALADLRARYALPSDAGKEWLTGQIASFTAQRDSACEARNRAGERCLAQRGKVKKLEQYLCELEVERFDRECMSSNTLLQTLEQRLAEPEPAPPFRARCVPDAL